MSDLNKRYTELCAKLGNLVFQLHLLDLQVDNLQNKIDEASNEERDIIKELLEINNAALHLKAEKNQQVEETTNE